MKSCPECSRDYDSSMMFCLDDGAELLYGGEAPGPLATALVAFKLPSIVDSLVFRKTMQDKYNLVLKMTEKRWFNGMRISPHVFNTEADIDAALKVIASELT